MEEEQEEQLRKVFAMPLCKGEKVRMKLKSGVKEFDSVLRKTNKVRNIFTLGRGEKGSVSQSLLSNKNLCIPRQTLNKELIHKLYQLSFPQKRSKKTLPEMELYQLLSQKSISLLDLTSSQAEKKLLSDCIIVDDQLEKAFFYKQDDSHSLERMMSRMGRVLHYKKKLPPHLKNLPLEERLYHMRDKIDAFSQELQSLFTHETHVRRRKCQQTTSPK